MNYEEVKEDIQYFVYFLFKGSLNNRLIVSNSNYVRFLIDHRDKLYKCFSIFARDYRTNGLDKTCEIIAESIQVMIESNKNSQENIEDRWEFVVGNDIPFWDGFLNLSDAFCFNAFKDHLKNDYLKDFEGCGGDAVQPFAIWLNVLNIDKSGHILNADFALNRVNERMKEWEGIEPNIPFTLLELQQEIW